MKQQLTILLGILGLFGACTNDAPSSQADTLFSLLPVEHTQIDFVNEIRDEKQRNILIYNNYYNGGGVGLGDFNNDGLLDIYFTGNLVADRLYLNQGDFKFKDITETAGIIDNGAWSSGVTLVDINQDGWLDIYVSRDLYDDNRELRTNVLYINQGDLTFKEEAEAYGLNDSWRTRHATFFDYDRDGDLDAYLLNQPPNPGNYSEMLYANTKDTIYTARLYRNDGDGGFVDVSSEAKITRAGYALGVVTGDFNNDQWPDLYVANDYDAPDFLFINNQDGTFSNTIDENLGHISNNSMGVDLGDINNDGFMDLVVLDMVAEDNRRQKINMSGMNPDQFWQTVEEGGHYQYMFNTLQLNQGNGRFSEIGQMAGISNTDWSWAPLLADFDNDGWNDLYITNGLMRDIRNKDADKKFPQYIDSLVQATVQQNPQAGTIDFWDIIDLDHALSLLPSEKLVNYAFRNQGDYTFTKSMIKWGLNHASFSNGAAYGDLDNDGDLDLVVNNINDPAFVYENNASQLNENHYLRIKLKPKTDLTYLDAKVSIYYDGGSQHQYTTNVRGFYSTSEDVIHFGLGDNSKVDSVTVLWADGSSQVVTNIQVDQEFIIEYEGTSLIAKSNLHSGVIFEEVTQPMGVNFVHQENPYDDFATETLLPHKMSSFGPGLAVGDINADGLDDFYVGGAHNQSGRLFVQTGNGTFNADLSSVWSSEATYEDLDAAFFDADNDGDLDLYVVSGGSEFEPQSALYIDRLYVNDGQGRFSKSIDRLPQLAFSGSKVRPADMDGDGDLDLLVTGRLSPGRYPYAGTSYLLENQDGYFKDVTSTRAPELARIGMVTDAVWSDFDQDQDLDILLTGEWMPTHLLKSNDGAFTDVTAEYKLDSLSGWGFALEAVDLDGDGDEDYLVGNLGLNYKYRASTEAPFEVYASDFDDNGSLDIVLGYYNQGQIFPLRGRECSSGQMPFIKTKFPDYNSFANASLSDVYSDERLSSALHLRANNFAHGYWENLSGQGFKWHALPAETQFSSINDFVVYDFTGNGQRDVVSVGNLFASEVETPRNDAGIGSLLTIQNDLIYIPNHQTGLLLPHDGKNAAIAKTSQGAFLLVANNNAQLQIIKIHQSRKNQQGL